MSYMCETRLEDLSTQSRLEVTCNQCGQTRFENPRDLITKARLYHTPLDKVEAALSCMSRQCRGMVTLSVIAEGTREVFNDDMPVARRA